MSEKLFDAITLLHRKLAAEQLDIHHTKDSLHQIVKIGRQSQKLRIITQFLNLLEVLAKKYEYADADIIFQVKELIKQGLGTIERMVSGTLNNADGATILSGISREIHHFLSHDLPANALIYEELLMEQFAVDLEKDIELIREAEKNPQAENLYKTILYYLKRIQDNSLFLGMSQPAKVAEAMQQTLKKNNFHETLLSSSFQTALDFLEKNAAFIRKNLKDQNAITEYFLNLDASDIIQQLSNIEHENQTLPNGVILTAEEINALMADDIQSFEEISFDDVPTAPKARLLPEDIIPASPQMLLQERHEVFIPEPAKEKNIDTPQFPSEKKSPDHEDTLIQLAGKLFLKQETLKSLISEDNRMLIGNDLQELEAITAHLKEKLFNKYYISVSELLGKDLRTFIKEEVDTLGKKIKLGIRGEQSEILARDADFVKALTFHLVKNSLEYSLEAPIRRRALDKNEVGWLLIEFSDSGGEFEIQVRDDGRGLSPAMHIDAVKKQVESKKGSLSIDSEDNEYLKIRITLPMKKILTRNLLLRVGETKILIPMKSVKQVLDIHSKENPIIQNDPLCLGQVSFAAALGLEKSPINVLIVCGFGEEKIVFGAEQVFGQIDALTEDIDTPLIPCASGAVILKDGSIGFLMNEKELYQKSKNLLMKRAESLSKYKTNKGNL